MVTFYKTSIGFGKIYKNKTKKEVLLSEIVMFDFLKT